MVFCTASRVATALGFSKTEYRQENLGGGSGSYRTKNHFPNPHARCKNYDMKKILLIHGPNLNMLGVRAHEHYGTLRLLDIEKLVGEEGAKLGFGVEAFQSNHEGVLIDFLQKEREHAVGIIINPGAFTHYSYALHDALVDTKLPCVEVHLSDISKREEWRRNSVTVPACIAQVSGKKEKGYVEALETLSNHLSNIRVS